jgi:hypothetical protein
MQVKERKSPKRILVNVKEEFHNEIKKRAFFRGQTMSSWIIMAISERIKAERKCE